MKQSPNPYDFWKQYDGRGVVLMGLACTIEVKTWYTTKNGGQLSASTFSSPYSVKPWYL